MEDSDLKYCYDIVDDVLNRFQVVNPTYRIILLSDDEFNIFNYECDVIKSFYYVMTQQKEFGFNSYRNKYLDMVTKEYGEFFYQSEDDIYISASLIHINKVYNTIEPVYNAINILKDRYGTDKDITFLHNMITSNMEYEYLILLRQKRHEELVEEDLKSNQIYMDLIHEALHIVEHEKPISGWKFWNKRKNFEEMDETTLELYNELLE
jgi:hypothetical protein